MLFFGYIFEILDGILSIQARVFRDNVRLTNGIGSRIQTLRMRNRRTVSRIQRAWNEIEVGLTSTNDFMRQCSYILAEPRAEYFAFYLGTTEVHEPMLLISDTQVAIEGENSRHCRLNQHKNKIEIFKWVNTIFSHFVYLMKLHDFFKFFYLAVYEAHFF